MSLQEMAFLVVTPTLVTTSQRDPGQSLLNWSPKQRLRTRLLVLQTSGPAWATAAPGWG